MKIEKKEQSKVNRITHICIIIFIIVVIAVFAGTIIFRYQIEGETDAFFDVSKIFIVSTAEAVSKSEPTAKWDCNVNQNNDLYITIEKNSKKQDSIKNVTINNIEVLQNPSIGEIAIYKPAETGLFKCDEKYRIENELIYSGSKEASLNNLEVSNQGGTIIIRFCNKNVGEYLSNDEDSISHDGKLLQKCGTKLEHLNSKIQFDINIETEKGIKYKSTINIDLPVGNIIEEGTCTKEIDAKEIILKRM